MTARAPTPARPTLVRAEGIHVWDRDGRRYLDATSGAFCAQLGYSRPDFVRAMAEAAERLPHARPSLFESEEGAEYKRALTEAARPPYTRVFLTSSGSEAVDVALKAAHAYQRGIGGAGKGVRYVGGHYHGATLGAIGVTGWGARRHGYEALVGTAEGGPPAYCRRCFRDLTFPTCGIACAEELCKGRAPTDPPSAVILETIPAAGLGAPVPPAGYFARIRARCDESGALWIADEVLSGFGRVGSLFAWQRLDAAARPDMVVFGKGAGAGFVALAGVLVTERVGAALDAAGFRHAQTHGGNPIACAVGRRVLAALQSEGALDRVRELEGAFEATLRSALGDLPGVYDIRGMGYLWGIEMVDTDTVAIAEGCRARGVLVHAAPATPGCAGTLLVAPPLISGTGDFEEIAAALRAAIAEPATR